MANVGGTLMALVTHEITSYDKYAKHIFSLQFENNKIKIPRSYDTLTLDTITMEQNDDEIRIDTINIYLGGCLTLMIDPYFMKQIDPTNVYYDNENNHMVYKLRLDQFGLDNLLIAQHNDVDIELKFNEENTNATTTLYGKMMLYDTQKRKDLFEKSHNIPIFQIRRCITTVIGKNMDFGVYYTNGFFIETNDNTKINKIIISVNGMIFNEYDRYQMKNVCNKYGNLIYLNFSDDKNIWTKDVTGGFNMRLDTMRVLIEPADAVEYIKIYSLIHTRFTHANGMYNAYFGGKFDDNYGLIEKINISNKQKEIDQIDYFRENLEDLVIEI